MRPILLAGLIVLASACSTPARRSHDADLDSWGPAIERELAKFPGAKIVVPGHGDPGGLELLAHTKALVDAASTTR